MQQYLDKKKQENLKNSTQNQDFFDFAKDFGSSQSKKDNNPFAVETKHQAKKYDVNDFQTVDQAKYDELN